MLFTSLIINEYRAVFRLSIAVWSDDVPVVGVDIHLVFYDGVFSKCRLKFRNISNFAECLE